MKIFFCLEKRQTFEISGFPEINPQLKHDLGLEEFLELEDTSNGFFENLEPGECMKKLSCCFATEFPTTGTIATW